MSQLRHDSQSVRPEPVERVKGLLDRWIARAAEHLVLAMIRKGEPDVVVLPNEEYRGYLETLELMKDEEAQAAIHEGEADAKAGRVRPYEEARRDLGLA